jgi:hypothetical protein
MGVRDGLTTWNASVELGGRVRGNLDVRVCTIIGESEKFANIYRRGKMSRTIHIDTGKHASHTLADPVRNISEIVECNGPRSGTACGHHRIAEVSGKSAIQALEAIIRSAK